MMLMIMIMTWDNPQTLNDDQPQHDIDDHDDDQGDVVGDYDCDDHHEHSVQPQRRTLLVC